MEANKITEEYRYANKANRRFTFCILPSEDKMSVSIGVACVYPANAHNKKIGRSEARKHASKKVGFETDFYFENRKGTRDILNDFIDEYCSLFLYNFQTYRGSKDMGWLLSQTYLDVAKRLVAWRLRGKEE